MRYRTGRRKNNGGSILITFIIYALTIYLIVHVTVIGIEKYVSQNELAYIVKEIAMSNFSMSNYFNDMDKRILEDSDIYSEIFMGILSEPAIEYADSRYVMNIADESEVKFFLDHANEELEYTNEGDSAISLQSNTANNSGGRNVETGENADNTDGNSGDNSSVENNGSESEENATGNTDGNGVAKAVSGLNIFQADKVKEINVSDLTYEYLIGNFYTVVSSTTLKPEDIDAQKLMNMDMKLKTDNSSPQILIYHTHGQEGFTDTVQGDSSTGIIGVGDYLYQLLTEEYGYNVIHLTDSFDLVNGVFDRSKAYDYAYDRVAQVLAENPSIEVVIDLHRDGVNENLHLVTEVNGKPTAKIMFFNGISRLNSIGEIGYLYNPYREENLAMSLQMKVLAEEYFEGFTRRNYIQAYQYNLHLRPKSMLIEAGAQTNSFEEVKNAMEPLAFMLHMLLG